MRRTSRRAVAYLFLAGTFAACEGDRGPAGDPGAQGEQGIEGPPGDDGERGAQGPEGPAGPAGPAGPKGDIGAPGMNGSDGDDGADGTDGADGEAGVDGVDGDDGDPGFARATFVVAANPGSAPTTARVSESYRSYFTFATGGNEGVAFDAAGRFYQASDVNAPTDPGSIRVVTRYHGDVTAAERVIGGPGTTLTGLVNPKGIAVADGLVMVANNGAARVSVFGASAAGDVAPVATTALAAQPWDLFYDAAGDVLYVALVNGEVAIFDGYVGGSFGAAGLSRTIVPVDGAGAKLSTNLHGIDYDDASDTLVVTDVGAANAAASPTFAADGSIYVFADASAADGNVAPARIIEGPLSRLGNPVDAILDGPDLRVAEKANDLLLVFRGVLNGPSGDAAPDLAVASIKPESLAFEPAWEDVVDTSDLDDPADGVRAVAVVSNPAGAATGRMVKLLSRGLNRELATFAFTTQAIESVAVDAMGDAWATYDDGDTATVGGIAVVGRYVSRTGTYSTSRDRVITGAATKLVSPKGIEVADGAGLVFVAENNAASPAILAFSTSAAGNAAPAFTTALTGIARPWDVDYDPASDRMYVALVNGDIRVYDDYVATAGVGSATRTITPSVAGVDVSDNAHGIVYVEAFDLLIVSDVGTNTTAPFMNDGELFVIDAASWSMGNVEVTTRIISTDTTPLANPVDIAFDGRNLYVAEKALDLLHWFPDVLSGSGDASSAAFTRGESLAIIPGWLY